MSNATVKKYTWTNFLQYYSEQNIGRPTRVGVFDNGNDYWLEDGLLLTGIDFDSHDNTIEILLGDVMTHTVKNVKTVKISFSLDEINDGLDITDSEGKTTILRFEEDLTK